MVFTPQLRRRIQVVLLFLMIVATIRLVRVFQERRETTADLEQAAQKAATPPLPADYYVVPKKLHAYDLKSAEQLTRQPVWVREGYRFTFYPWDEVRKRSDFGHPAGLLGPIERLEIKQVVLDRSPGSPDQRQVMAVFEKEGKSYAFPFGAERKGEFRIYADEMLFIQDPRELYRHWPADTWAAVERHQVLPGMNEFQVTFAVGMGRPEPETEPGVKRVTYPRDGRPLLVVYRDGKVAAVSDKQ
ncbi:MAG TPA: hypothetical protein VNK82_01610 [Terriglobales bacterium]|nr:hypothetical protein [Terriglobales bacterium]